MHRRRGRLPRYLEADPPGGVDGGRDVGLVALKDGVGVLVSAGTGGVGGRGDSEEWVAGAERRRIQRSRGHRGARQAGRGQARGAHRQKAARG
jgi:hypothetical protein